LNDFETTFYTYKPVQISNIYDPNFPIVGKPRVSVLTTTLYEKVKMKQKNFGNQ